MIKKKTAKSYLIHDNGGRPFKVKNIRDSCIRQKIPIEEIIEEVREPSKANKFWKWLVDLIG